jgi:hypothetical protein
MGTPASRLVIRIGHPGEPLRQGEAALVFLDLDEFDGVSLYDKARRAAQWIQDQRMEAADQHPILPGIVVMGAPELEPAAADELVKAGAIFRQKPEGYDNAFSEAKKNALLHEWFQSLHEEWALLDDEPVTQAYDAEDLSIYLDPPYQIHPEDYDRLWRRLQMPDNEPKKED